MKVLSIPKIKHYHYCYASFPPLHNRCILKKVIVKMYRLNFRYQITEQLHYKGIENASYQSEMKTMQAGGLGGGQAYGCLAGSSLCWQHFLCVLNFLFQLSQSGSS